MLLGMKECSAVQQLYHVPTAATSYHSDHVFLSERLLAHRATGCYAFSKTLPFTTQHATVTTAGCVGSYYHTQRKQLLRIFKSH